MYEVLTMVTHPEQDNETWIGEIWLRNIKTNDAQLFETVVDTDPAMFRYWLNSSVKAVEQALVTCDDDELWVCYESLLYQ